MEETNRISNKLINLAAFSVIFLMLAGGVYLVYKTVNYKSSEPITKSISLEGTGKVEGAPTVAEVSIGVITQGKEIATIAKNNTEKMNNFTAAMKKLKIEDKDLKTANYSIYPEYAQTEGKIAQIGGYRISQTLNVKVRDLAKVNDVLSAATELGANSVNGPTFTIDDDESLLAGAREKALAEIARKKAVLENSAGIKFGDIYNYNEWSDQPGPYPMMARAEMGGGVVGAPSYAPNIQPGSIEKTLHVTVMYEIE